MNRRERAASRAGMQPPPRPQPEAATDYERAMQGHDSDALAEWVMQRNLARIAQVVCIVGALVGLYYRGVPGLMIGGFLWWVFGHAKPGPTEQLDRYTNRKGR